MVDGLREVKASQAALDAVAALSGANDAGRFLTIPFAREARAGYETFFQYHIVLALDRHVTVAKRFSDFVEFHKQWKAGYANVDIAAPKKLFVVTEDDIAQRCVSLALYLRHCLQVAALVFPVARFLGVDEAALKQVLPNAHANFSAPPPAAPPSHQSFSASKRSVLSSSSSSSTRLRLPKIQAEEDGSFSALPATLESAWTRSTAAASAFRRGKDDVADEERRPRAHPSPPRASQTKRISSPRRSDLRGPPRPWPPPPGV